MASESDVDAQQALAAALAFIPYAYKGPESRYSGGAVFVVKDGTGAEATVHTVVVRVVDGLVTVETEGEDDDCDASAWLPPTVVTLSPQVLVGVLAGTTDPMLAMMCGQILVSDLNGLLAFASAFDFSKSRFEAFAAEVEPASGPTPIHSPPPSSSHGVAIPKGATAAAKAKAHSQAHLMQAARAAERARLIAEAKARGVRGAVVPAGNLPAASTSPLTSEDATESATRAAGVRAAMAASGAILLASLAAMRRQIEGFQPSEAYEAAKASLATIRDRLATNESLGALQASPVVAHMKMLVATYASTLRIERRAALVGSLAVEAGTRLAAAVRSATGNETPHQAAARRGAVRRERETLQAQLADLRAQNAALAETGTPCAPGSDPSDAAHAFEAALSSPDSSPAAT
ncbi:uncharacterized protein AMSG_00982 [Thecamonas trahens ATCC 50062]|uniref:Uncharacterized protein n=1 Tax=Thecamonas trahens ATCC 50062 TaxID=461836 RepID=A0A0L0DJB4_THETB|nr:hypothetical protein AMSG_00982 [Thecamonas trahens ATCC 50062]KNC52156.1 hypothetical protein AMSG_00982 [Thecamonas trahens ATCC 50062]|eukprot:XP_013762159.1 hypothetical protein AMSG_00982 [Thecamonas trahens ATCC 50062]